MPLNIISVSEPCASMVIFPDVVVKFIAASPAVMSSAAEDIPTTLPLNVAVPANVTLPSNVPPSTYLL